MTAVIHEDPAYEPHMKAPLLLSALFHGLVVLIAIVGLPYMTPELPMIDNSITVELVDVTEIAQTDKKPEIKPIERKPPEEKKEEPPKPVMPQVTATTPPKPVAPAPPEKIEEFASPDKVPEEVKKKPEPVAAKAPPKPIKRPTLTKAEEPQQDEFKSLLRNLMPTEEEAVKTEEKGAGEQASPLAQFSQKMSMSEMDGLKRQLSQCWSLMAGARYAEDLVVDLKLFVNPDRTIRDVKIENILRYNTDNYFRAAADSAKRAVFRCSPLDLPPNKYDLWKTITVTFDPRTML